jgi:DedD protein
MDMPPKQIDASPDAQLDLKKRARRRLIGAAALALLAAVVLPMIMDREPQQPAQDVQVRIPSQDGGGLAARVPPGKPTAMPLPVPESDSRSAPKVEAKPPATHQEVEVATPMPTAVDKPAAKVSDKAAEKLADRSTEKAAAKPMEKPIDKPVPGKREEAKALAALSGTSSTADQWVVQLGAYKEAGNIKVLLAKLKQMGVPAYTETFDSPQGARTRVRAGPFKSSDEAEKAKIKIRVIGVDGPVAPK